MSLNNKFINSYWPKANFISVRTMSMKSSIAGFNNLLVNCVDVIGEKQNC